MHMKVKAKDVVEAFGTVQSGPMSKKADGYAFIETDDGITVYVPKAVVAASGFRPSDMPDARARIKYARLASGKWTASRMRMIRDEPDSDQLIVDALSAMDEALEEMENRIDEVYAMLRARGCKVPEIAGE